MYPVESFYSSAADAAEAAGKISKKNKVMLLVIVLACYEFPSKQACNY